MIFYMIKISDSQRKQAWKMYCEDRPSISHIARTMEISYSTAWILTEGRRRGFKNHGERRRFLISLKDFEKESEYKNNLAERNNFIDYPAYREYQVENKGYNNFRAYEKHLQEKRQSNPQNIEFSNLINIRLELLGKNLTWLAWQIGVSRQAISIYSLGKHLPTKDKLERLYSVLQIKNTMRHHGLKAVV